LKKHRLREKKNKGCLSLFYYFLVDINIEEEDKFAEDLDLREVLESSRKKLKMDQADI